MKKREYYKIANLLKTEAAYMILLGMRANGKSYAAKETVLRDAYENGVNFVYLRRWREDIKRASVEAYFADMPIEKITVGEYNTIIAWQGSLYFAVLTDDNKVERGRKIGRYCALNEAVRYKSQAFVNYGWILYEEFITDEVYLSEEPTKLQQFISTVARLDSIKVLLIGNTMSRVCPYFNEWQLQGTLRQRPGTIEIYHMHYKEFTVDIAVENCEVLQRDSTLFFGNAAKQIISGEWDVKESPRLPGKLKDYDEIYRLDVKYNMFAFHLCLLTDGSGQLILYIFPAKKQDKGIRLLTEDFIPEPQASKHLNPKSKAEAKIKECWLQGNVCYSDNLTAADFINLNKQYSIF